MSEQLRYSKVSRRIWLDAGFRSLSAPEPNGRDCFLRLLTASEQGPIPGLFHAWPAGIAQSLGWSTEGFGEALAEVLVNGMAELDETIGLWFLPNALRHNEPESPNTVRGWRSQWRELPDSPLKLRATEHFLAHFRAKGEAWEKAFLEAIGERAPAPSSNPSGKRAQKTRKNQAVEPKVQDPPKAPSTDSQPNVDPSPKASVMPSGKASANQEQEQEQEDLGSSSSARVVTQADIPCPPDLALTDDEFGQLALGVGMSREFVERATPQLRAGFLSHEPRTLSKWRRTLVTALRTSWGDPRRKNELLGKVPTPRRAGPVQPNHGGGVDLIALTGAEVLR